jgi:hypothetical protein
MSKTKPKASPPSEVREMRPEYRFDYARARPNRFAGLLGDATVTVVLDPDVAAVFTTSESVNEFLRSVIAALPASARTASAPRSRKRAG